MTTPSSPSSTLPSEALERFRVFFEALTPDTLAQLAGVYRSDVRFKDPFNEVIGLEAVRAIFEHMFQALHTPRFQVIDTSIAPNLAMITWTLHYRSRADQVQASHIHGASLLRFDESGLCFEHRDYWDAAEELYEKQPVLGALMRFIKRRLATPQR